MVVAAGLLADAVQNLQELKVLPGRSMTLWNVSGSLPDDTGIGDVLHGLVGYSAAPTVLQVVIWAAFLGIGLTLFLRPRRTGGAPPAVRPPATAADAVIDCDRRARRLRDWHSVR